MSHALIVLTQFILLGACITQFYKFAIERHRGRRRSYDYFPLLIVVCGTLSYYAYTWGRLAFGLLCSLVFIMLSLVLGYLRRPKHYNELEVVWFINRHCVVAAIIGSVVASCTLNLTTTTEYDVWTPHAHYLVATTESYVDQEGDRLTFQYSDGELVTRAIASARVDQRDDARAFLKMNYYYRQPFVVVQERVKISRCWIAGESWSERVGPIYEVYISNGDLSYHS